MLNQVGTTPTTKYGPLGNQFWHLRKTSNYACPHVHNKGGCNQIGRLFRGNPLFGRFKRETKRKAILQGVSPPQKNDISPKKAIHLRLDPRFWGHPGRPGTASACAAAWGPWRSASPRPPPWGGEVTGGGIKGAVPHNKGMLSTRTSCPVRTREGARENLIHTQHQKVKAFVDSCSEFPPPPNKLKLL